MAPLVIEGKTLGEIHHKYNTLVNDAIKNKKYEITDINYDDPDLDNLFKIDIASKSRNVEYILKVLQCTDMLYVSRAINKSPWLITDKQYAYIINPEYLFNELRLQMMSKAFNKLILKIRILLRDEERVEEFYKYYEDKDLPTARKWLPHCSEPFIKSFLENNGYQATNNLMRRLCKKSIEFFYIFARYSKLIYYLDYLCETTFVMKNDVNRYLDIIDEAPYYTPTFTAKYTKIIMTKSRKRIMEKLNKYGNYIDVPTFAKYISEEEIKYFILTYVKQTNNATWFKDQKIIFLINKLQSDVRFEFTKTLPVSNDVVQNNYTMYMFAPFETAFADLKKTIPTISNANERIAILKVLLTTAGHDVRNIQTLLKYYREHHINEPFKFKIEFINIVLSQTKPYRYDKSTWNSLKGIFSSMKVFIESDKNVESCVRSVLLYCVINDETIPEIIEKKIQFETLKQYKNNLSQEEQDKIFNYLLTSICSKIQIDKIQNEKEFEVTFGILENALILLCDWDKDLKDYSSIIENIEQLIKVKKENTAWKLDIKSLYNKKKSWKKLLFAESLLISPAQDTVMNALKHDSKLVDTYKNQIEKLLKDNQNLDLFFNKIRIYWPQSLANSFKEFLINNLQHSYNHKHFISGLCHLLPHREGTEIIKKYAPSETKIDWSQYDEVQLAIRKYLAMSLYVARPQPSLDMVLMYAKGDYLQYSLPSLNAILYNMSTSNVRQNIKALLNSPVSLQKHGIRAATLKLKHEDLKHILSDIWKSHKNSSIRANIFVYIHNRLWQETNEKLIKEMWESIKMFIDTLTPDEDKQIYTTLSTVENVPMCIRAEYWVKSYTFLKSLPATADCGSLIDHLFFKMSSVMHDLDDDFVVNIFMTSFDKHYCTQDYKDAHHVESFLLSAKTEKAQMIRYNKMFVPMLTKALREWDRPNLGRHNISKMIKSLYGMLYITESEDLFFPIKMLTQILETMQKTITETDNYIFMTFQKLGLKYITTVDKVLREGKVKDPESFKKFETKYILRDNTVGPEFGKACVEQLQEDIANSFSSIYVPFAEAFNNVCRLCAISQLNSLTALEAFIKDKEFIEGYLFVLQVLPKHLYDDKQKTLKNDILNKIREHPNKEIKIHYSLFLK